MAAPLPVSFGTVRTPPERSLSHSIEENYECGELEQCSDGVRSYNYLSGGIESTANVSTIGEGRAEIELPDGRTIEDFFIGLTRTPALTVTYAYSDLSSFFWFEEDLEHTDLGGDDVTADDYFAEAEALSPEDAFTSAAALEPTSFFSEAEAIEPDDAFSSGLPLEPTDFFG